VAATAALLTENVPRKRLEFRAVNAAVTPPGNPEADSVTLPANPFCGIIEMAAAPLADLPTIRLLGASVTTKSGGGKTVTASVRLPVRVPEIPLMVSGDAFAGTELAAVIVRVLVAFVLAGLNVAVTPAGKPAAVKATVPLKPPCGATVMVATPVLPAITVMLEAEEESLKPGAAVIVKASGALSEILPDVAAMVRLAVPTVAEPDAVSVS
jgi:hypothetical protein